VEQTEYLSGHCVLRSIVLKHIESSIVVMRN